MSCRCAASFLCAQPNFAQNSQVPDFAAGYVVPQDKFTLSRRCLRTLGGSGGCVLTIDGVQAGIASAGVVAEIVSVSPEWEAIVESTRKAAAAAALVRRNAYLRQFDSESTAAVELIDSLTISNPPSPLAASGANHSGIFRLAAVESAERESSVLGESSLLGGIGVNLPRTSAGGVASGQQPREPQLQRLDRITSGPGAAAR